jgi:hypothetical protein
MRRIDRYERDPIDFLHSRVNGSNARVDSLQKRMKVPTIPLYNSVDWPDDAVRGQLARSKKDPSSLWMYGEDDLWHNVNTITRARQEITYNPDHYQIFPSNGAEVVLEWDRFFTSNKDEIGPIYFKENQPQLGLNLGMKVPGVWAVTYRVFFDVDSDQPIGPGFVDCPIITQVYEPDWDGFCGYEHYHHSCDNGCYGTITFTTGPNIKEDWGRGQDMYLTVRALGGHGQYIGDPSFGVSHPGYFQGTYMEVVRIGSANVDDLTQAHEYDGEYVPGSYTLGSGGGLIGSAMEFPVHTPGYSDGAVSSAAQAYADAHPGYEPHMLMQEGHIETPGGVPSVWVKYFTPTGSSTELTPLT